MVNIFEKEERNNLKMSIHSLVVKNYLYIIIASMIASFRDFMVHHKAN